MKTKKTAKTTRCPWAQTGGDLYEAYHDTEWGVPVHDDRKHFEFLILEGAQAGLSWLTILKRREGYREAFSDFDPQKVARYDAAKIESLMAFEGIIRNKLKILSCVSNAKLFLDIQKEYGSFDKYVWPFVGGKTLQNRRKTLKDVPPETPESRALSADLRKRGFKFVGPTVMYAYMQATGLVNDHLVDCMCHSKCTATKKQDWEVYIIQTTDGKLYTGITTDLSRRFNEHQTSPKGARFFHFSSAVKIVFQETHPNRSEATRRELSIKKMPRSAKEALIQSYQSLQ